MPSSDAHHDCVHALRRRAARFVRRGEARKAVLALREAAARDPSGPSHVLLSHALRRAGQHDEALRALRQALFCFRHEDARGKARTVARLILALDPSDPAARRRAA